MEVKQTEMPNLNLEMIRNKSSGKAKAKAKPKAKSKAKAKAKGKALGKAKAKAKAKAKSKAKAKAKAAMGQDEPASAEGPAAAAAGGAGSSQEQRHSIRYKIEHRTATNAYAIRKSWRVGQLAKEFKRQVVELKCKSLSPELGRSIAERAQAQLQQGEAEQAVKAWVIAEVAKALQK